MKVILLICVLRKGNRLSKLASECASQERTFELNNKMKPDKAPWKTRISVRGYCKDKSYEIGMSGEHICGQYVWSE